MIRMIKMIRMLMMIIRMTMMLITWSEVRGARRICCCCPRIGGPEAEGAEGRKVTEPLCRWCWASSRRIRMVVPVLVRAGTYTCEVVVVVKGAAIDGLIEGVEMRPMEGARVIGLELVEQLTRLVITWRGMLVGFEVDSWTGLILAKLLFETVEGFRITNGFTFGAATVLTVSEVTRSWIFTKPGIGFRGFVFVDASLVCVFCGRNDAFPFSISLFVFAAASEDCFSWSLMPPTPCSTLFTSSTSPRSSGSTSLEGGIGWIPSTGSLVGTRLRFGDSLSRTFCLIFLPALCSSFVEVILET